MFEYTNATLHGAPKQRRASGRYAPRTLLSSSDNTVACVLQGISPYSSMMVACTAIHKPARCDRQRCRSCAEAATMHSNTAPVTYMNAKTM